MSLSWDSQGQYRETVGIWAQPKLRDSGKDSRHSAETPQRLYLKKDPPLEIETKGKQSKSNRN